MAGRVTGKRIPSYRMGYGLMRFVISTVAGKKYRTVFTGRCLECWVEVTLPRAIYCESCAGDSKEIQRKIRSGVAKLRLEVLERDGYLCQYCWSPVTNETAEIDHRTPVSRGGSGSLENLATTCHGCNWAKGTRTAEEYSKLSAALPEMFK
jgi:hypothetical protein